MNYLEAFTKLQSQTPIFPPEGMTWTDTDPTAFPWGKQFDICRKISRTEAIQLISKFPCPVLPQKPRHQKQQSAIEKLSFSFAIVGAFLSRWEKGEEASDLRRPGTGLFEAFALLAEARYKKIRGLFDRPEQVDLSDFGSAAFLWLLCEGAVCRKMLITSGIELSELQLKSHRTKEGLYNSSKDYLEMIWEPCEAEQSQRFHTSTDEVLTLLDRDIDAIARQVAANDKNFDKGYYKPYLQARKHYNVLFRITPEAKIIDATEELPVTRKRSRGKKDLCKEL